MGDTVNLASRLEGANKYLGTDILLSEDTVNLLPKAMVVREVDRIRAQGRNAALGVFEPVALDLANLAEDQQSGLSCYAEALALLRGGEPNRAVALLADLAEHDGVAAALKLRAQELVLSGGRYSHGVLVLRDK